MTKIRQLKVTEDAQVRGRLHNRKTVRNPRIKLSGKWLQQAGFAVGQFVEVLIVDQVIHIVKKQTK
jgi:hypothetical protein